MHAAPQAYTCMRTRATRTTHTHIRICARARVWGNAPNSLLAATCNPEGAAICSPKGKCCGKYKKVAKKFGGFKKSRTFACGTKFISL